MEFYGGKISDAEIVKESTYQKRFLQGNMFGSFSFINVGLGKEEFGDGHSPKNMVEIAVVSEILTNLLKGKYLLILYIYVICFLWFFLICLFF